MKRMPRGKKNKKRVEKLILRMMVAPNDLFIYKIYINIYIYNAERLQLKKKKIPQQENERTSFCFREFTSIVFITKFKE